MAKSLVIVESPAKAKTIGKFLGKNYKILASVGHVRDLPKSKMGINIENHFEPEYITIRGKGPIIQELKKEAKKAKKVLLATDPDREGEAISWHLAHILALDSKEKCRIEFHEITENAIKSAVKKARPINKNLVDAQQARRVLDRLVGYSISPLLWRKIRKGLSAGRVQSVTVKLICDRENEIERFQPEEYWTLEGFLQDQKTNSIIEAKFYGTDDEKIELANEEQVKSIINQLDKEGYVVTDVKRKEKKRNPYPPFTTSSLQQEAANRLGFATKKTMIIAQQLYEGIDIIGEGSVGLVTYIRTDSTRISEEARQKARQYITEKFSETYTNEIEKDYKMKKDAQDAHEAIRPTSVEREPEKIKESLSKDQFRLYKLIWERFLASQMRNALYDTFTLEIKNRKYIFKSSGSKLVFDGFLKVYTYASVTDNEIPEVALNQKLVQNSLESKQHFTQPPPRFTEAALVKELEDKGIGRPSTYAPTITTIMSREYVERVGKSLKPTDLGIIVTELLTEYFPSIVDKDFTADMEKNLDYIEDGDLNWIEVIDKFYGPFETTLKCAEEEIEKIELVEEVTDEKCENCGKNMVVKHGKFGKFLACSGYPECDYTKPYVTKIGVLCPICGGDIIERRSKKGRLFYGCGNFPKCSFVSWNKPINEKCPTCESLLTEKITKKGTFKQCTNKECGFKLAVEEE